MLTINKRILIFSLAYFPVEGGAEIATKEIADRLPDIKFDMVTKKFEQSHRSFERVGNVNVYRLNSAKLFFPFKAYWFARNLHKQKPYDAIWSIMAVWRQLSLRLNSLTLNSFLLSKKATPLVILRDGQYLFGHSLKKFLLKRALCKSYQTILKVMLDKWVIEEK